MKLLQHASKTSETLETYAYNMGFSPFFSSSFPRRSAKWWMGSGAVEGSAVEAPYGVEQMGQRGRAANELSHLDTKHRQNVT
jgi:hypothetical protein